jgi:hypothetical protein
MPKAGHRDGLIHRVDDRGRVSLGHFAEKYQREMHLLGPDPLDRRPRVAHGRRDALLFRAHRSPRRIVEVDGYEKTHRECCRRQLTVNGRQEFTVNRTVNGRLLTAAKAKTARLS